MCIVEAIEKLERDPRIDVIVLARGGGDPTALLAFSDEAVCRAMCATTKPVVSAIGHDGDHPLSDEVADLRCGTPSIAAQMIVPSREELLRELEEWQASGASVLLRRVHSAELRLQRVDNRSALVRLCDRNEDRLTGALRRLASVRLIDHITRSEARLQFVLQNIESLSPARVLERGYVIARDADGTFLRKVDQVQVGQTVTLQLVDGTISTTVNDRKRK